MVYDSSLTMLCWVGISEIFRKCCDQYTNKSTLGTAYIESLMQRNKENHSKCIRSNHWLQLHPVATRFLSLVRLQKEHPLLQCTIAVGLDYLIITIYLNTLRTTCTWIPTTLIWLHWIICQKWKKRLYHYGKVLQTIIHILQTCAAQLTSSEHITTLWKATCNRGISHYACNANLIK